MDIVQVLASLLPIQLPVNEFERQQMLAQVLGPLPPKWEDKMKFLAPGSVSELGLKQWMEVSPSISISFYHSAFQINK